MANLVRSKVEQGSLTRLAEIPGRPLERRGNASPREMAVTGAIPDRTRRIGRPGFVRTPHRTPPGRARRAPGLPSRIARPRRLGAFGDAPGGRADVTASETARAAIVAA